MFNSLRKGLMVSVRIRRKFLAQSTYEGVLSPKLRSRARCLDNVAYKRFYCHTTIDEQNVTSIELKNRKQKLDKQKLDELLSDPQNKKRFQILELEVDFLRHNGDRVPDNIEQENWLILLNMMNKTRRKKYLAFLWRNEKSMQNVKAKKELKKAEWLAKQEEQDSDEMKYGLSQNSLFLRIYEKTINRFYNGRLIQNMMFEPKIVFDCSYENDMNQRETHNCAKQMNLAFASNRTHINPLCLYFCNFNTDGLLKQYLHQNIPTLLNDDFPVTITSQSYLDMFPKDQLVYLTPHCRINLTEYDPDMVYIIGAYVDKNNGQPLSMAKAKRDGIRMARFPIDKYLDWGSSSSKNFTLDQTMKIMLDLRHTGDWKKALEHVPVRKLKPARENMLRSKLQRSSISPIFSDKPESQKSQVPLDFTFQKRNKII